MDKGVLVLLVLAIGTVLFGTKAMEVISKLLGLGSGWSDILQGFLSFLFLIIGAIRSVVVRNSRRKKTNKFTKYKYE